MISCKSALTQCVGCQHTLMRAPLDASSVAMGESSQKSCGPPIRSHVGLQSWKDAKSEGWFKSWKVVKSGNDSRRGSLGQKSITASIKSGIERRHDEAFMQAWREERATSLQPRDASLPTAACRLAALKERLRLKGAA